MKKIKFRLLRSFILAFAAIYLISCSGSDKNLQIVPEDATMLASFNIKKLAVKANVKELKETDFFQEEILGDNDALIEMVEKPSISGINFAKDVFFFTFEDESNYNGFVFALKNKKKFEEFLEEYYSEEDEDFDFDVEEEDKYSWINTGYGGAVVWNNSMAFILESGYGVSDDDLEDMIEEMMEAKSGNSVLKSDLFKQLKKIGKDINMAYNVEEMAYSKMLEETYDEIGLEDQIEVEMAMLGISFDKGSASLEAKVKYSDDTEELIDEYKFVKGSPDGKIIDALPGDEIIGAISASIDIKKIKDFVMNQEKWANNIDVMEEQTTMDVDDLVEKLDGDMVVALHNINEGDFIVSFALAVSSEDVLDDYLDLMEKQGMEIEETDGYYNFGMVFIGVKDGILFGTTDEDYAKEIADGPDVKLSDSKVGKKLTKSPINISINLNKEELPDKAQEAIERGLGDMMMDSEEAMDLLDGAYAHADLHEAKVEIELTSSKKNSLALIFDAISNAYEEEE